MCSWRTRGPERRLLARHLLSSRAFSSAIPLTPNTLIAVGDTILMYLNYSQMGLDLDRASSNPSLGAKIRIISEVQLRATLYTLSPFNYTPDMTGIQAYAMAMHSALTSAKSQDAQELKDIHSKMWKILIGKTFQISHPVWLSVPMARRVGLATSVAMQSPATLELAETYGVANQSDPAAALERYYEKVIIPCYYQGLKGDGLALDDKSFAVAYGSLQVHAQTDGLLAQNMQSGLMACAEKSPLLRGGMGA